EVSEACCFSVPVAVIVALLLSVSFRLDLKSSRGSRRSSLASAASSCSAGSSAVNVIAPLDAGATIASTASFSWSIKNCSDIFITQARAQVLQRAKLQLFYCSLAPAQLLSNLANTFLFGKTQTHYVALVPGKLIHQLVNPRDGFSLFEIIIDAGLRALDQRPNRRFRPGFPLQALCAIGNRVSGDAKEPGGERRAAPLKLAQVCESLMKNMRGQLFRRGALANSPGDIGIDAFEVQFIQLAKAARILLRRLDQGPFFLLVIWTLQTSPHSTRSRHRYPHAKPRRTFFYLYKLSWKEKVMVETREKEGSRQSTFGVR